MIAQIEQKQTRTGEAPMGCCRTGLGKAYFLHKNILDFKMQ